MLQLSVSWCMEDIFTLTKCQNIFLLSYSYRIHTWCTEWRCVNEAYRCMRQILLSWISTAGPLPIQNHSVTTHLTRYRVACVTVLIIWASLLTNLSFKLGPRHQQRALSDSWYPRTPHHCYHPLQTPNTASVTNTTLPKLELMSFTTAFVNNL